MKFLLHGVAILCLLLAPSPFRLDHGGGGGVGLVDGQLYTNFDDLADKHKLPLAYIFEGADDKSSEVEKKKITCMAKIAWTWLDRYPHLSESRDYFRGRIYDSNYNPHYFCSNVPKFGSGQLTLNERRGDYHATPHAQFWMNETTAWIWSHRYVQSSTEPGPVTGERLMEAKDMGFIFTVNVTGIKSRGRFLKGWYHLAIKLDVDHNIKNKTAEDGGTLQYPFYPDPATAAAKAAEYRQNYQIDKLMVTARGRILIPGKNRVAVNVWLGNEVHAKLERPARRAWVGGIGEFVKDFPKCNETSYNPKAPYVDQQFMPCGAVQYSESTYGNNFYYTRKHGDAKYGNTQGDTIHLNFRLDNTFCNRYYDLDFVANGIVVNKATKIDPARGADGKSPYNSKYDVFVVQRSISTRFVFISSFVHHGPSYYENAEPIPRHVEDVECDQPLQGEWRMKEGGTGYRFSVTQGADLELNPNARPDSTFGGAIKFIYNVPDNLLQSDKEVKETFNRRRTWTYPDLFVTPGSGTGPQGMWTSWRDLKEFPIGARLSGVSPQIFTAVQRVLHEFDWESWKAIYERDGGIAKYPSTAYDGNEKVEGLPQKWDTFTGGTERGQTPLGCRKGLRENCNAICRVHEQDSTNALYAGGEHWPHAYYDATCIGLEIFHSTHVRDPLKTIDYGKEEKRSPDKFEKLRPPILGRCETDLYYNDGVGTRRSIAPKCDEFFQDYKDFKTSDPALRVVMQALEDSGRGDWKPSTISSTICGVVEKLKEEFPDGCPFVPPRPYTTLSPNETPNKTAIEKKESDFKTTRAYQRGIMVAENPFTLFVYDARVLHGLTMTIIVMFITPVSIFLTRYYKETFMDSRVFLHRIWYFVHIAASILTPLLFLVAMWRLMGSKELLGVSLAKSGMIHRGLGWIAIAIASALMLLGGLRCMNRCIRAIIILLHFILGFAFYYISLALIIVSVWIPGSPSAYQDFSVEDKADPTVAANPFMEPVFILLVVWIIFDLVINIFMTVLQCRNDKKMKLTQPRVCFGAGMPVIMENYRFDTPGRFCRINVLRVYLAVALLTTIGVCCCVRLYSPRGRGYGFMTCTHNISGSNNKQQPDVVTSYPEECRSKFGDGNNTSTE